MAADHVLYLGSDTECDYLLRIYTADQTAELATRPRGGARWSAPTPLTAVETAAAVRS